MPEHDFTVRPAKPEDDEAEIALSHASALHHASIDPDRWRPQTLTEVAASRRHWHAIRPRDGTLVAVADGHVIGVIDLWLRRPADPRDARIARVAVELAISVDAAWRGRGIGTALMLAAEDWARARGAERMALGLDGANARALRLYERLGYDVHGLEMDKVIEPDPAAATTPGADGVVAGEALPTLHGDHVTLRPLRADDRPALIEVLSDPTVAEWWDSRAPEVSAAEMFAEDPAVVRFAIDVDGVLAGSIQYAEELEPDYRHAGIDIIIRSRFEGRGLGSDAVRTLAGYLLNVRGHHRLTIDPAAANARAIHVYEKVGFKPVGVMRNYERGRDGTFHDGLLMDLLAGELR